MNQSMAQVAQCMTHSMQMSQAFLQKKHANIQQHHHPFTVSNPIGDVYNFETKQFNVEVGKPINDTDGEHQNYHVL